MHSSTHPERLGCSRPPGIWWRSPTACCGITAKRMPWQSSHGRSYGPAFTRTDPDSLGPERSTCSTKRERERDRVHGEDPGGTWSRSEFRLKACAEGDTASVASAPWEYGNRNAVKSPAGTKAQKLKILAGLEPNSYAECSDFYINVTRSPTLPNAVACPCSASCHLKISIAASRASLHVGGTHTIS